MNETATDVSRLEFHLGYAFHDKQLLQQALTHTSAAAAHMERLEFLGDAVLGIIITEELYRRFPDATEGKLTRMRAALVCRAALLRVAADWRVEALLMVGPGERDADGRIRSASICANAVEAVIGALFLDADWETVRKLVADAWQSRLDAAGSSDGRDAKTRLQEYTQARDWGLPEYVITDHGAGHKPRFSALCLVRGKQAGKGFGERKKIAESEAASQAWNQLQAGNP